MQWIGYEELVDGVWLTRKWVLGKWIGRQGRGKGAKWKDAAGKRQDNVHVWSVHLVDAESGFSFCGRPKMELIEPGVIEQGLVNDAVTCKECLRYAIDLRNAVRVYEGQLFRNWQQG